LHKKTGLSIWIAGCKQSKVQQARRARRSGQVFTLAFLIDGRKTGAYNHGYRLHHMNKITVNGKKYSIGGKMLSDGNHTNAVSYCQIGKGINNN
jgi:hypothetical protein